MKTLVLSDVDIQTIVDALQLKHAVLVNTLLRHDEPQTKTIEASAEPVAQAPVMQPEVKTEKYKYGVKKDGTPRKPPGRPRKAKK